MNAQSTSGYGKSKDNDTEYWSISNGKGLPQMFWDWWKKNQDTKFRVTYTRHANEQHNDDFTGELKADRWIMDDFYLRDNPTEVVECHYDMNDTTRPRKFIMNLPFYNKNNDSAEWNPVWNYCVSFAANNVDPNHLEVVTVWKRRDGHRGNPNQRNKYSKGVGTPKEFQR